MEIINVVYYILFFAFILVGVIHLSFFLFTFSRFSFLKKIDKDSPKQPVSVIICAKNEVNNLRKYLHVVLEQSYPEYEVIVVNDCSWDETGEYLKEMLKNYPNLKVVTIPEQDKYRHGKKFALTLGIKAAKHELLLFTDADCMPLSKNWISLVQRNFTQGKDIVLGYGAYLEEKGFLNRLIRFDTFMIAMQYFSFALKGNPYMGVGRNLSYRKSLFFQNKGFAKHNHLYSGDDDLFVNEIATAGNVTIEIDKESFTTSVPKSSFKDWMRQKSRHGTTARYYKPKHQFQLALLSLSNFFFLTLLITLLILQFHPVVVLGIYLLKLLAEWIVSFMASKKLNEKDLMWLYPVLEIVMIFLQPIFFISSLFTKQRAWK